MKKNEWIGPQFVKSAVSTKEFPSLKNDRGNLLPEIAIVGRSNVGKSSLLNHLFKTKNLARVSSTPGKTQLINFYNLDKKITFVDLPGYGFASVPLTVRAKWGPMIQNYLNERAQLKLVLFLFDIRRIPHPDDIELMKWIIHAKKSVILILTKVDKLSIQKRYVATQEILSAFHLHNLHYVHYSALKNIGRDSLLSLLSDAFADEVI